MRYQTALRPDDRHSLFQLFDFSILIEQLEKHINNQGTPTKKIYDKVAEFFNHIKYDVEDRNAIGDLPEDAELEGEFWMSRQDIMPSRTY